jgi:hypothetical protein
MKRVIARFRQKYLVQVLRFFSITGILFVFQACYGTPTDLVLDQSIKGKVFDAESGKPIEGVKISVNHFLSGYSDPDGFFEVWVEQSDQYKMVFEDTDGELHGLYAPTDTLFDHSSSQINLLIKMALK